MKKRLLISLIIILVLTMSMMMIACGEKTANKEEVKADQTEENKASDKNETKNNNQGKEEKDTKEKVKIGVVTMTLNNPHFISWKEGLESVIIPKGDTFIHLDPQFDINKQISNVEDLIQEDCDVIMIAPVDSKAIKTAILSCNKADIPVIIMDIPISEEDSKLVTSTVCTDNFSAGRLVGEALIENSGGKAKVGLIDLSISEAVRARTDGFFDAIKDYPDIEVVARQDADPTTEAALPVMENFLQSNPEIDHVFCINDLQAMGAMAACEAAKRTDISIYGIDGSQDVIRLIKQGRIYGTSAQFPFKMGKIAAETAYKIIDGKEVEHMIKVKSKFIDKSNYEDYLGKTF